MVATAGYSITAGVQLHVMQRASEDSAAQTKQLIDAATKTEAAAEKSAKASRDFADTAGSINMSIGAAVDKLNLQAGALKESVSQASRIAKATEAANANVLAADRPWFGGVIHVSDFEVGKAPGAVCDFVNSGRRPASVQFAGCGGVFGSAFPKNPVFKNVSGIISRSFIVPGSTVSAPIASLFTGDQGAPGLFQNGQPTDGLIKQLGTRNLILFVYGEIDYTDVRSGEKHFTHTCVQYNPPTVMGPAGFFLCETYNDGN